MQGNISPRSVDAICSLVVKGRKRCANSCELTAYIGLPFCCVLASQPLHRASVCLSVCLCSSVSTSTLFSVLSLASLYPYAEIGKASLAIQTPLAKKIAQKTASNGENAYTFVYSQEFDYTWWF